MEHRCCAGRAGDRARQTRVEIRRLQRTRSGVEARKRHAADTVDVHERATDYQMGADVIHCPSLAVEVRVERSHRAGRKIELHQPLSCEPVDRAEVAGRVQILTVGAVREAPDLTVDARRERAHELRRLVIGEEIRPRVVGARQRLEHLGERPSHVDRGADLRRGPGIAVPGPCSLDIRHVLDSQLADQRRRRTRRRDDDSETHNRS